MTNAVCDQASPSTSARFRSPPESSWLKGHHSDFMADKLGFLVRTAKEYGDIVPLRFGPVRIHLISDPPIIGEILTARSASFRKDISMRRSKVLLGEGLLTSEGAEHERRSRIAQPSFRPKEVEAFAAGMIEETEALASGWRDGEAIDLAADMSRLALGIVGRALFGADLHREAPELGATITELLGLLDDRMNRLVPIPLFVPTPANRRFKRGLKVLDDAVFAMIRTRRERPGEHHDLLARLLGAGGGEGCAGPGLTDEQLRDEVMTLFLAGHETTANALSFTFWLLARNPDVEARLRADPNPTFVSEVFSEALRLYPPAWALGREATEDVALGGGRLTMRCGELAMFLPFIVQRDPRFWSDPLAFKPERFAPDAPRPVPYAYIPFGGGKRSCIGRSFAMIESQAIIPTLLRLVRFEIDTGGRAEPALNPLMTLRPDGGVKAFVRKVAPAG